MKNSTQNTVDYLDGFQYAGSQLQFFPTSEGYVKATRLDKSQTEFRFNYIYNYTDHLGNVRLSYTLDPQEGTLKIVDENHYYPFGLRHEVHYPSGNRLDFHPSTILNGGQVGDPVHLINVTKTEYMYRYNGKEWQDELGLNWTAMDFRNYDPAIGRFHVIDPMTAFAPSHTPYRFGFNNPVYWADPTGLYEVSRVNNNINIFLNEEEMLAYQAMLNSGVLDGLSGQDLVDAIVDGLEEAGFSNDYDYALEGVIITGSANSGKNDSKYAFLNQCIIGCHQTPGMQRGNTGNPFFKRTKSETFYLGGWGSGGFAHNNKFYRPGVDKLEENELLEYLSMLRSGFGSASSMSLQAYSDIFTMVQMWEANGSTGSPIEVLGPTNITTQDEMIKFQMEKAIPINNATRGFAPYAEGLQTIEVHRKDSAKAVQETKRINDSIRSLPWPK